jgi:transposase
VHEVVERLDLRRFLEVYSEEGDRLYHPSMMLKVSPHGYALGDDEFAAVGAADRLEQRIRIKEGRCVRGRKKQARRGRKPNVSPVR